ncbi:MAG: isoprenylcysteine carboxylmethyltransferase family protein [Planctomycetes bacterium]|nr:isoprenylcysteine carboxylmethyltransferase family protein [Planctomycetota bacterium]
MPHPTFTIVYLAGLVTGCGIRAVYARRRKNARDRRFTITEGVLLGLAGVGLQIVPLVYVCGPWLDFADYGLPVPLAVAAGSVGTILFAAALWLLWRAHVDLGRNWSALVEIQAEHTLVTGGVYRRIRHPMYAAHWLWAIAQALLLQNWIAGGSFIVSFLPLYLLRVPREERAMLDHFGDAYRQYTAHTGRMWPRRRGRE